jgi:hypothetical protein
MAANNLQINVNVGGNALTQLQAVESRIKKTDAAVKQSARGYTVFGAAADKSTDKTRRFAQAGIQQAGFQLGDFAVQLQNGTSFLTAFGQQGSQLLGVFGAVGAVLGAVVAVGAALGTVILKARDSTKSFSDEVEDLGDNVETLSGFLLDNKTKFEFLRKEYGKATAEVDRLFQAQKRLAEFEVANSLRKTTEALQKELSIVGGLIRAQDELANEKRKVSRFGIDFATKEQLQIARVTKELNISENEANRLADIFRELGALDPFNNPLKTASKLNEITNILTQQGFDNLSKSQLETIENLLNFEVALRQVNKDIEETAFAFDLSKQNVEDLTKTIGTSFSAAFTSVIRGTDNVKDAFRNMATAVIDELIRILVVQEMVAKFETGIRGFFARGTSPGATQTTEGLVPLARPRAIGGSVQRGQPYMVGERGAELFVPSQSGSIVPNKDISGGNGVTINQTINVSTGVQQTVRTEIASLMPQIAEATKSAVADARMRGGSYSKAFGS